MNHTHTLAANDTSIAPRLHADLPSALRVAAEHEYSVGIAKSLEQMAADADAGDLKGLLDAGESYAELTLADTGASSEVVAHRAAIVVGLYKIARGAYAGRECVGQYLVTVCQSAP